MENLNNELGKVQIEYKDAEGKIHSKPMRKNTEQINDWDINGTRHKVSCKNVYD